MKDLRSIVLAVPSPAPIVFPFAVSFLHIPARVPQRRLPVIGLLRLHRFRLPLPVLFPVRKRFPGALQIFRGGVRIFLHHVLRLQLPFLIPEHQPDRIKGHMTFQLPGPFLFLQDKLMRTSVPSGIPVRSLTEILHAVLLRQDMDRPILLRSDLLQRKNIAPGGQRIIRLLHFSQADLKLDSLLCQLLLLLIRKKAVRPAGLKVLQRGEIKVHIVQKQLLLLLCQRAPRLRSVLQASASPQRPPFFCLIRLRFSGHGIGKSLRRVFSSPIRPFAAGKSQRAGQADCRQAAPVFSSVHVDPHFHPSGRMIFSDRNAYFPRPSRSKLRPADFYRRL